MTSKTFHDDDRTLEVQENEGKVNLYIEGKINELGVEIAPSDAPALCLAILEAAGYSEDDRKVSNSLYVTEFASAMIKLADGIELQERATAEAKEQAELEAEAVKLINAYRDAMGFKPCDWDAVEESDRKNWLAVAGKSREMRAEK